MALAVRTSPSTSAAGAVSPLPPNPQHTTALVSAWIAQLWLLLPSMAVAVPFDPSPYVRSAAAWALATVQAEGVVEKLTERLVVEEEGPVRSELVAALDGLGDGRLDALTTVRGMILDESNPIARYRMARYLGGNLDAYPQGLEPLTELAVSDPSIRIRKYAVGIVTGDRDG